MILAQTQVPAIKGKLIKWYHQHKRALPFRKTKDPYKIWLSEIMAQQTTMTVVLDYYKRFMRKYPTVTSVATAKEQDLLLLWQGLGYYARIRNFQKACQIIVEKFNGRIPQSSAELKKLPGIGTYTAAAIASICFHEPIAVIDGNVKRVLARLFCFKKEVSSQQANTFFAQTSAQLLDKKNPGDFNQAMMELGALICTRKPLCAQCLVKKFCASVGKNPEELPYKKKTNWINKRINLHIMHSNKNILLKKPTQDSLVKGMWELPLQLQHSNTPTLKHFVRHTITNKRITAHVTLQQLTDAQLTKQACGDLECVPWEHLDNLPIGTLSRKALASYLRRTP